jgi:hypothetical protein
MDPPFVTNETLLHEVIVYKGQNMVKYFVGKYTTEFHSVLQQRK